MRLFTLLSPITIISGFILIAGCSNVQEASSNKTYQQERFAENSFIFKKDEDRWRVDFEDGEIAAIYKNGERISSDSHHIYKDMIYNRVNRLRNNLRDPKPELFAFKFDMSELNSNLKEMTNRLRENLPDKIEVEIDKEEFNKGMEALSEAMKELKTQKFKFNFDEESFREDMKKLKEDLKKIDTDKIKNKIKIEVRRNIDDVEKELEKIKIEIKDLDIDLKGLDVDLKKLNIKMEKLDNFLKELKSELVKDGYIKSEDDKVSFIMNDEVISINGEEITPEHQKKYLDIYEKHFNKERKGDFKIRIRK